MLSVPIEYVKKSANISRQVKTSQGMHKTPSKTKRKKSTLYYARKKSTPISKKVLAISEKISDGKYMESRTTLNTRKIKFTT